MVRGGFYLRGPPAERGETHGRHQVVKDQHLKFQHQFIEEESTIIIWRKNTDGENIKIASSGTTDRLLSQITEVQITEVTAVPTIS